MLKHRSTGRFFFLVAVVITGVAFVGFSRTYFLMEWTGAPSLPWEVHFHAIASTAFIVIFLVQTLLIDRNRSDLHRSLGIAGVIIAATMTVSAFPAAFAMAIERGGTPVAIVRLGLPFVAMPVFAVLVVAGFLNRNRPNVHKRLMLFAAINALTPAMGRLPYVRDYVPLGFFAVAAAFVITPFIYDWLSDRRIHKVTFLAGLLVLLSVPGRVAFGTSEFWHSIGASLIE